MKIKYIGFSVGALLSFLSSFYSAVCLLLFLSSSKRNQEDLIYSSELDDQLQAVYSLFIDYALLALFIIQHSAMANSKFKQFIERLGLKVLERSIYNFATSFCLIVNINYYPIYEILYMKLSYEI